MWVRFEGQGELSFEYNGKRFFFKKSTPPVNIAVEIYDYVKASGTVESVWLRPCDAPNTPSGNTDELVNENKRLKEENKKLLDRIEHLQKQNQEKKKKK